MSLERIIDMLCRPNSPSCAAPSLVGVFTPLGPLRALRHTSTSTPGCSAPRCKSRRGRHASGTGSRSPCCTSSRRSTSSATTTRATLKRRWCWPASSAGSTTACTTAPSFRRVLSRTALPTLSRRRWQPRVPRPSLRRVRRCALARARKEGGCCWSKRVGLGCREWRDAVSSFCVCVFSLL